MVDVDQELPGGGKPAAHRSLPRSTRRALASLVALAAVALVATAATPGIVTVKVRGGDSLWSLAKAHHTSVARIRQLNHIPASSDLILEGQLLQLPGTEADGPAPVPAAPVPARQATSRTAHYVVRAGDTVSAIATRFRVTTLAVIAANRLPASGRILAGQQLAIPGGVEPARSTGAAATPATRYPLTMSASIQWHRRELARRPLPGPDQVRAMVTKAAKDYGVDPALALAIAWQESGWRQGVVSGADAIGIMQVLPSTGRWLGTAVFGRELDLLDANDNVRAGVKLLAMLTKMAPLNQAIAGYYQGLASVRANGMFPDTQRYVASVLALRARFR